MGQTLVLELKHFIHGETEVWSNYFEIKMVKLEFSSDHSNV